MRTRTSTLLVLVPQLLLCAACAQPTSPAGAEATEGAEHDSTTEGATSVTVEHDLQPSAEAPTAPAVASDQALVFVNGVQLTSPDLAELNAILGATPISGRYWYDATSGLWGLEAHGAGGVTRPGLRTAAPLPPGASAGTTGAFVNGRQLPLTELTAMATLLSWPLPADSRYDGHYTLDGDGALNSSKGRYLGNVATAAKRLSAGQPPGATVCTWYHLHEPDALFGRDVTITCD